MRDLITQFELSYRSTIAHILGILVVLGLVLLLLRKLWGHRFPFLDFSRWFEGSPLPKKTHTPGEPLPLKYLILIAMFIILLAWAPYLFKGQDVHVKIFDNLDSHVPHTKTLADSGKALSLDTDAKLDNFLNGVYLSTVDSGYNLMTWLFILFPPFWAYALNQLLMKLAAFLGMMLLLKYHVFKGKGKNHVVITGAALCFSLLPFYPAGGLSVAGLPLIWFAFLNIRNRRPKWTDYLIIVIFPFYSRLALSGVFVAISLAILLAWDIWKQKKINYKFLGGLALFTVTYIFTHFHLVYSFINPNFTSFREEISMLAVETGKAIQNTKHNFLFDRVNVVSAHHMFVLAAAFIAIGIGLFKKVKIHALALLVAATLTTSVMWGFKYWELIIPLRENFQLINAFDFSRFYWFNPFLWYIIFALALWVIAKNVKRGHILALLFIVFQVIYMFAFYNWEYRHMAGMKGSFAGSRLTYSLTFRQFYSSDLFEEINSHIGKPRESYRVVSFGIHPGIAQFNGFYTLDIYTDVYSLEYKHKFRKIMEKELEKDPAMAAGFDNNAKRCFLMAAELHGNKRLRGLAFSRGITKRDQHIKILSLDIDAEAIKALGGQYVFSAVEIVNHKENCLELEKIFQSKNSPWRIYLYKVL